MRKRKLIVLLIALCALIPIIGTQAMNWDIFAVGSSAASSLSTGDEVHLGTAADDVFVMLGQQGDYVYFLKKNALEKAKDYGSALSEANNYKNDDNFGKVGNSYLSLAGNKVGLISKAELQGTGAVSGNDIVSSVKIDNGKWWLVDADTTANRASFVNDHDLAAVNEIKESINPGGIVYNDSTGGTCSTTTKKEVGILPIIKFESAAIKNQYVSEARINISGTMTQRRFTTFKQQNCSVVKTSNATIAQGSVSASVTYTNNGNGSESWKSANGVPYIGAAMIASGRRPRILLDNNGNAVIQDQSITYNFSSNTCYNFWNSNIDTNTNTSSPASVKILNNPTITLNSSYNANGVTITDTKCPIEINEAGEALVRPYVRFKASDLLLRNRAKRAYAPSSTLNTGDVPVSDNAGDFLTIQNKSLSVGLDRSVKGVVGDTYSIPKPASGTVIELPLTFGSSPQEGNRYVSAEAVDINGNTVYAVLDSVAGNTANVEIDYANLLKPGANSFTVKLYLEDSGIGNTSYRSEAKEITVYMKDPQYIKFSDGTPSSATYGDRIDVYAELYDYHTESDGSIRQSKSALVFGVEPNSDGTYNARIVKQEYDFATGKAHAVIEPLVGDGIFTLKINKDKDSFFFAADEKKMDFRLEKRDLKIVPPIITSAVVGDRMASLYPDIVSGSLVKGDDIPTGLYPNLVPTDPAFAAHPSKDGKFISDPGTWGLHFPNMSDPALLADPDVSSFLNKYNVEYEDYNDNTDYVFVVDPNGIPDSWFEIIPPTPNGSNGWYNTDVIIRPSSLAKAFGYFEIALVDNGVDGPFGSEIILNNDVFSLRPTLKLKKRDLPDGTLGEITKAKQIGTRIKIDKTMPKLEKVDIPSGWATPSKTVSILASDNISDIDTVNVYYKNPSGTNDPMSVMNTGGGSYRVDVTQNGTYVIEVVDKAGNTLTTTRIIDGIDTPASITATPAAAPSASGDYHDITITTVEPASGIRYIDVYYREDGTDPYRKIGGLNPAVSPQTYAAQMNGDYKFEMVTGKGDTFFDEVTIVDITQKTPVVSITAINMGTSATYYPNSWINQDVKITLSNTNLTFTDPIIFQYRKVSDTTWTDLTADTLEIQTSKWLNEEYLFKAVSGSVESRPVSIIVKIDKEKPQPPKLNQANNSIFYADTKITGQVIPKDSKIPQIWEYSMDQGITWSQAYGDEFALMGIGTHDIQVRSVDEAGNISDVDVYTMEIKDALTQEIAFDSVPTSMVYGTCTTITAKLTSDVKDQANTPLVFSIPASYVGKATIKSQTYDSSTGIATANVCATSGDGFFDIEINKAGDAKAKPAVTKSVSIALTKIPVTVYPQIIYGKIVGDTMPTLISDGSGLVNGDRVPNAFTIVLTPDVGTTDPLPFDSGNTTITHAGTWTMTYPANILTSTDPDIVDFLNKYDVTLADYNSDPKYVFTVTATGIPDGWVIVSPNANGDGWNNTDVTLSLSDDAKAAGYTSLALIENGAETLNGSTVLLSNNTYGMYPIVVLKKADGTLSDKKTVRYVMIDKSLPTANVTIADETIWTKTDKQVTIQVADTFSGIKDVTLTDDSGNAVALSPAGVDTYSFMADNGTYHLTLIDYADNKNEIAITVDKIDKTAPRITATLGALSASKDSQDIDVNASVGASGVGSFAVYYKEKASDAYPTTPLDTLNPATLTCVYQAHKNGFYLFEIVNGVGDRATAEVEVVDVAAVLPVVNIKAELDDGKLTPYANGTWVNQDVMITLSNTNTTISEPITYEYRKVGDSTWTALTNNQITIQESAWQNNEYEFRGVISTGPGASSTIRICIDKEKPAVPTIADANNFNKNNAFAAPLTISGSTTPKNSGIAQTIWVSEDRGITWSEMIADQLTLTSPDTYALTFKTIDEAGNESDEYTIEDIIVNDGTPTITIRLNKNPIKTVINRLTFGYFFKNQVDVDIEVNWYGMAAGDISYILDDSTTPSVPSDSDSRWTSGDHTTINPDRKTMIYAKAVNSDGKIAMASSSSFVIADQTAPTITFDHNYTDWISDNTLTATVNDNLAGVDNDTITAKIDHSDKGNIEVKGSSLHFTSLPDGNYKLQVSAADNSGNAYSETIMVKIDTTAPLIDGVKDKSVYHHYYLPRYITVSDQHSGVKTATITKDGGSSSAITGNVTVKDIGTYAIDTVDHAGNEQKLTFEIIALPDIKTEINCSDESKQIIDQIEQEYALAKDYMDATEIANIEKWLSDAHDIRNTCRIKVVYNEDKSAWIEGVGDVDFPIDMVLVIDDIAPSTLPNLPEKARLAYDVYLLQGNKKVNPDGMVSVHLPYRGSDPDPILYEINDAHKVKEISAKHSSDHLIFETDTLWKYAISMKEDPDQPSINIDWDCDGKPDINIDVDDDGIPDVNIDTTGDGKPNYNVDLDGDGKPDMNIGPIRWNPDQCVKTNCGKPYCTSTYYKPYLNIDTDHDGRPDVNLDLNGDKVADINIDIDGDLIPDIEIDSDGDGKADINLDTTGNGRADTNLAIITVWKPDRDVDGSIKYDTMSGIKIDETLTPDTWQSSKEYWDNKNLSNGVINDQVNSGDRTKMLFLWIIFILSALFMASAHIWHKKMKRSS